MKNRLHYYILYILLLTVLFNLTACSKWNQRDPTMPEDLIEYNEQILIEQLTILETEPENVDALFEVAFRYQQLGKWKKAVEYYEKVLEQASTDWATLNNLAYIYETLEEYDTAAEYIKRLYESDQSSVEVIKDTVRILLKAGDALNAEHALQNFEKLTIDPENPDPDFQALVDELYEKIYTWAEENSQDVN